MIPPRVSVDAVREKIGTYADKQQTAEQRYQIYKDLIGFLPPRIEARINVTGALDPELLDLQERMRACAMAGNHHRRQDVQRFAPVLSRAWPG